MKESKSLSWTNNYISGLVSVIVPVYNAEKYLQRAIDSALCQDYRKIELILIDDGSSDLSGKICDFAAAKDTRVRVIHQSNRGPGAARNAGLKIAQGEYLAFLDGDDWMAPSMISEMVCVLKKMDSDIVICNYYIVSDKEKFSYYRIQEEKSLSQKEAVKMLLDDKIIRNFSCDKVFERKTFDHVFYLEDCHFEDVGTIYKTFLNADKITLYPKALYYYYQNVNSITHAYLKGQRETLKNDYDIVKVSIGRQKVLSLKYRDLAYRLARETDFNLLKLYNETIVFKNVDKSIRKEYQCKIKKVIKQNYSTIMKNPLSSRQHKLRINILLYCPTLYKMSLRLLYKKRGNYS